MAGNRTTRTDVVDTDFVDAVELISDGYSVAYREEALVSTTNAGKIVVITGGFGITDRLDNIDEPVESGDAVEITGSIAAGRYTVDQIVDSFTFTVRESIADSTDGYAAFYHPPGASKVGIDNSKLSYTDATTVQGALEDLAVGSLPLPVQPGNIMLSIDGLKFHVVQPVTTTSGWLVNEAGLLLVIPEDTELR